MANYYYNINFVLLEHSGLLSVAGPFGDSTRGRRSTCTLYLINHGILSVFDHLHSSSVDGAGHGSGGSTDPRLHDSCGSIQGSDCGSARGSGGSSGGSSIRGSDGGSAQGSGGGSIQGSDCGSARGSGGGSIHGSGRRTGHGGISGGSTPYGYATPHHPVIGGPDPCPHCCSSPCIVSNPPSFLVGSSVADVRNANKRYPLYRKFWTLLKDIGLWNYKPYLVRKSARTNRADVQDIIPSCVTNVSKSVYTFYFVCVCE